MRVLISGDKGIGENELASFYGDKASFEACVTGFHAFYLISGQYQTRLVVIFEGIIKTSSFILCDGGHILSYTIKDYDMKPLFDISLFFLLFLLTVP